MPEYPLSTASVTRSRFRWHVEVEHTCPEHCDRTRRSFFTRRAAQQYCDHELNRFNDCFIKHVNKGYRIP